MKNETFSTHVITPEQMLEHWQGHRNLTRRVIEAFPGDSLFTHTIGGMRPFSEMAVELIQVAGPGISAIVSGQWKEFGDMSDFKAETSPKTKDELLALWDRVTEHINELWPKISEERFQQKEIAFGQYEGEIWSHLCYFIDNEIHHRGQAYVYLRDLGVEPPFFWER
ncbi:DinB family protein [Balneolales bacterium ANBcel1]|nr:DinB family protein [Balneolales bacterium ANBcel1]